MATVNFDGITIKTTKAHADVIVKLIVSRELVSEGCTEVELRKLYSSITGQKLFGICRINVHWPELKLIDKIINQEIPWHSFRPYAVAKFAARINADCKRKSGMPMSKDERCLEPITLEEISNYFKDRVEAHRAERKDK